MGMAVFGKNDLRSAFDQPLGSDNKKPSGLAAGRFCPWGLGDAAGGAPGSDQYLRTSGAGATATGAGGE